MLQESAITGGLFLVGIALNSWQMFLGALIGLVAGTAAATALRFDSKQIEQGLYGFNGTLVGIAMFCFLPLHWSTAVFALVGAALSSLMMYGFLRAGAPAFTAPFVIMTWICLFVAQWSKTASPAPVTVAVTFLNSIEAILKGIGQVMFQENALSGLLFLLGIFLHSKKSAIWCFGGSVLGAAVALSLGYSTVAIAAGLYGYNATLCAIALAGLNPGFSLCAMVLSTVLTSVAGQVGIIALTAPFVVSTWAALAASRIFRKKPKAES